MSDIDEIIGRTPSGNPIIDALADEVARLRALVCDVAPLMLTVNAFGAEEADQSELAAMARWYAQQERSYSAFDAWLDAYHAALAARGDK